MGIAGTRRVGCTLTVSTARWSSGVTFTYQWYLSGVAVAGANGKTYVVAASHTGLRIKVKVSASRTGYATVSKTSGSTSKIKAPSCDVQPGRPAW